MPIDLSGGERPQSGSPETGRTRFRSRCRRWRAGWSLLAGALLVGAAPTGLGGPLAWDALAKTQLAKPGETNVHFVFNVTNAAGAGDVVITGVRPSCGCTTTRLPALPWRLGPGMGGQLAADVDIRGKRGVVSKVVFVDSAAGTNVLSLIITIPEDRTRNQELALADRQAVFRGECATCHVQPAVGRTGAALYQAACGICHDSGHRASMVPNLAALGKPTDRDYWTQWVRHGKPGSLMPAFAQAEGGPLDEAQILSLLDHLSGLRSPGPATATVSP